MPTKTAFGSFTDDDLKNTAFGDLSSTNQAKTTSFPQVRDMARARLASVGMTPEQIKAHPADPVHGQYGANPMPHEASQSSPLQWTSDLLGGMLKAPVEMAHNIIQAPAQIATGLPYALAGPHSVGVGPKVYPGQPNPAPALPMPQGETPESMMTTAGRGALTIAGLHPVVGAAEGLASIPGLWNESMRRGQVGQTHADMYGVPAFLAATAAAPHVGRAILPTDIAAELATRAQRSSLGTDFKSFEHGATPDIATLQDPAGSVYRSQGRQIKGIRADKTNELAALEHDMAAPQHQGNYSDPMVSIKPVMEEAKSRATPPEQTKIEEFNSLILNKIRDLSAGNDKPMQLNPQQLVQLKRWVDGFISTYKNEPIGTTRDLAQNVYSAVRQHLEGVAPESAVRGQRIQSLIQAEQAATKQMYSPMPEAKTTIGAIKNMFEPIVPSTLAKTATAAVFKKLSGGLLDRPPIPYNPEFAVPNNPMPPEPEMSQTSPSSGPPPLSPNKAIEAPASPPVGKFDPAARIAANRAKVAEANEISKTATPDERGLSISEIRQRRAAQTIPGIEPAPTHIKEGSQVSGMAPSGTLVSGRLERLYPRMGEDGKPSWYGQVLDPKTGKTVDIPATQLFDKLKGPK